jgi:UDP-N-acetylglucosamine 2-epimerase (non-hydrolysing)
MVYLMSQVAFAMSDSGGLQEEFPTFSKPLLVLREATERPELLDAGMGKLVGVEPDVVRPAVHELLTALKVGQLPPWYRSGANPFGDGLASKRIVARLIKDLAQPSQPSLSSSQAAL